MEQRMTTIPFNIDLAKKIQAEEHPGKIVTMDGRDVKILYWDAKNYYPIIALIIDSSIKESIESYTIDGKRYNDGDISSFDILLQVPEWTQFKDGDVLACEVNCGIDNDFKWFSILKGNIEMNFGKLTFSSYASCNYKSCENDTGYVVYDTKSKNVEFISIATEEEKQMFISRLQEENTDKAKDILKRLFGIDKYEKKLKYEFTPFEKVLVRDDSNQRWHATLFSNINGKDKHYKYITVCGHYHQCIPYNDETKHLLGTTDNWEK